MLPCLWTGGRRTARRPRLYRATSAPRSHAHPAGVAQPESGGGHRRRAARGVAVGGPGGKLDRRRGGDLSGACRRHRPFRAGAFALDDPAPAAAIAGGRLHRPAQCGRHHAAGRRRALGLCPRPDPLAFAPPLLRRLRPRHDERAGRPSAPLRQCRLRQRPFSAHRSRGDHAGA